MRGRVAETRGSPSTRIPAGNCAGITLASPSPGSRSRFPPAGMRCIRAANVSFSKVTLTDQGRAKAAIYKPRGCYNVVQPASLVQQRVQQTHEHL